MSRFQQAMMAIEDGCVSLLGKHYVFASFGSNQVYEVNSIAPAKQVRRFTDVIFSKTNHAKLFLLPVLPHLFDNDYAKQYIIEYNKVLANVAKDMCTLGLAVRFLLVQNSYIVNGKPHDRLYEADRLTFNVNGCKRLKHLVFVVAGFKANKC